MICKVHEEEKPLLPGAIVGRHWHRCEVYCRVPGSNGNHPIQHLKMDCFYAYIYKLRRCMIIYTALDR